MPEPTQRLTARALIEVKQPHSPHVSPDGKRAVFVVDEPDFEESRWVPHLWLTDLEKGDSRQITFSYEGEREPRWSPDGRVIAFLSTRPDMTEPPPQDDDEEEERAQNEQVWTLPALGGEAQKLTSSKSGVRSYAWAPDSASIVCLVPEAPPPPMRFVQQDARKRKVDLTEENKPRPRMQVWEVTIEDRRPALLYTGDRGMSDIAMAPDGKRIAYASNGTGDPNDYHQFDVFVLELDAEEEPRRLADRPGPKFRPLWSPDGSTVAFLTHLDSNLSFSESRLMLVPVSGGIPVDAAPDLHRDIETYVWARDGAILATVEDGVDEPIYRVQEGGAVRLSAASEPIGCWDLDASADGTIVAVLESDRSPAELYRIAPDGTRVALTELGRDLRERCYIPHQEVINWTSDGLTIEGLLTRPSGNPEGPLPLIVQVHGGPHAHETRTLMTYGQHTLWATDGYLVLRLNYRGSSGYGNDFAVANRRDLGGGDLRDILAGVDHLVADGIADPKRIGIMGGSYGGYMASRAVGKTQRFAAAASLFGVFDLMSDYSNSEMPRWEVDYMGAHYWEDPDIYRMCSPAADVANIETPMLIIHGDADTNTFVSNSRELYRALKDRGKTVEFVHYPREGHGLREPNHRLDEIRRCLTWFDRYLKGAENLPPAYRAGDRVEHDGWVIQVVRAEDPQCVAWDAERGRLVDVTVTLASRDPCTEGWHLPLSEFRVLRAEGTLCPLAGVTVDVGGGKTVVEGTDQLVCLHPDRDTGLVSLAISLAFVIPSDADVLTLQLDDFPPIRFAAPPPHEDDADDTTTMDPVDGMLQAAPDDSGETR